MQSFKPRILDRVPVYFTLILLSTLFLNSCNNQIEPFTSEYYIERIQNERSDNTLIENKIDSLVSIMTLEEKAGQMLHINLARTSPFDTIAFDKNFKTEKHLSYPDENGKSIIENGDFVLMAGSESVRFSYYD